MVRQEQMRAAKFHKIFRMNDDNANSYISYNLIYKKGSIIMLYTNL